jgi:hypothetical protein
MENLERTEPLSARRPKGATDIIRTNSMKDDMAAELATRFPNSTLPKGSVPNGQVPNAKGVYEIMSASKQGVILAEEEASMIQVLNSREVGFKPNKRPDLCSHVSCGGSVSDTAAKIWDGTFDLGLELELMAQAGSEFSEKVRRFGARLSCGEDGIKAGLGKDVPVQATISRTVTEESRT